MSSDDLSREFTYTVLCDKIDADIFDSWTRADDIRHLSRFVKKVMERIVEKWDSSVTIDHKNINCFDNRRSNLRLITRSEQEFNKQPSRRNTSGHTGVSRVQNTWRASFFKDKQNISKSFEYTAAGLKEACAYYRQVLRADGSTCATCFPETVVEEKIDMTDVMARSFTYTIVFSQEDTTRFHEWTRSQDARHVERFYTKIAMEIFGAYDKKKLTVDHINRNVFDNRRANLRLLSYSDQVENRRVARNNTSGHQGVCKCTRKRKNGTKPYWKVACRKQGSVVEKLFPYTQFSLLQACAYYCKLRGGNYICETCESTFTASSMGRIIDETEDYITFEQ